MAKKKSKAKKSSKSKSESSKPKGRKPASQKVIQPGTKEIGPSGKPMDFTPERGQTEDEGAVEIEQLLEEAGEAEFTDEGYEVGEYEGDPDAAEAALKRLRQSGEIQDAVDAITESEGAEQDVEADEGSESEERLRSLEDLGVDPSETAIRVKIDGEEQQISLEEAAQGYQRQQDYTRKTQELSEQRQELQQLQQQYGQELEMLASTLGQALTPEQQQALAAKYQQVAQQAATIQQAQHVETLQEEKAKLQERLGWDTPEEAAKGASELREYAYSVGFSEPEISSVADSRVFEILDKARRFDRLQRENLDGSGRKKDSPTLKPGTRSQTPKKKRAEQRFKKALARLDKSGSESAAADAILAGGLLD